MWDSIFKALSGPLLAKLALVVVLIAAFLFLRRKDTEGTMVGYAVLAIFLGLRDVAFAFFPNVALFNASDLALFGVLLYLGQKLSDPYQMYLCDVCTIPVNIAGLPGISVPCGMLEGLPVGLQVIAPAFAETTMLKVAYAYEQSGHFTAGKPNL